MAEILLDTQVAPSTPAAGTMIVYPETTTGQFVSKDSSGKYNTFGDVSNQSTVAQAYTTSEIYIAGSALTVPVHGLQVGARCKWRVVVSKTNGTGAPVWKLYKGTLGTTGDTAIATLTQASAPTAVADTAVYDIEALLRNVGASGVMLFSLSMVHALQITGFSQVPNNAQFVAATAFDTTAASLILGISVNYSTAGAGNIEHISSKLDCT